VRQIGAVAGGVTAAAATRGRSDKWLQMSCLEILVALVRSWHPDCFTSGQSSKFRLHQRADDRADIERLLQYRN